MVAQHLDPLDPLGEEPRGRARRRRALLLPGEAHVVRRQRDTVLPAQVVAEPKGRDEPAGRRGWIVGHDAQPAVLERGHFDGEPRDVLVLGVSAHELLGHGRRDELRRWLVGKDRARLADEPDDDVAAYGRRRGAGGAQRECDENEREERTAHGG